MSSLQKLPFPQVSQRNQGSGPDPARGSGNSNNNNNSSTRIRIPLPSASTASSSTLSSPPERSIPPSSLTHIPTPTSSTPTTSMVMEEPYSFCDELLPLDNHHLQFCPSSLQSQSQSQPPVNNNINSNINSNVNMNIHISASSKQLKPKSKFYNDMIELILLNSETRDHSHRHQPSKLFDGQDGQGHNHGRNKSHRGGGGGKHHYKSIALGKLTGDDLDQLSLFSSTSVHASVGATNSNMSMGTNEHDCDWTAIEMDFVTTLSGLLEDHVKNASSVDLIREGRVEFDRGSNEWFDSKSNSMSPGQKRFIILQQGIQAATILLSIMITPHIDRRVINEDAIEAIIGLMRWHLRRNVIATLSGTGHTHMYSASIVSGNTCGNGQPPSKRQKLEKKQEEGMASSATSASSPKKGRKNKSPSSQALIKFLKKIYSPIISTVGLFTNLLERLDLLIQSVAIEDQPLLSICSSALSSLTIEAAASGGSGNSSGSIVNQIISLTLAIQTSCLSLITTVFRMYPRHRIVVLEDLFPLFLKIPTSKKSTRTFAVRPDADVLLAFSSNSKLKSSLRKSATMSNTYGAGCGDDGQVFIQVISALVLSIIQSCVTMPQIKRIEDIHSDGYTENNQADDETKDRRLTNGLQGCEQTCNSFVTKLIQRCDKKGGEGGASEFRPVLVNLVEDLLMVQILPEYPAAEMLLMHIFKQLSDDLMRNANKKKSSEATYLSTAMDTIGMICSDVAGKKSLARESPLIFPKAVDINTVNEDGDPMRDKKEVQRCFCGRKKLLDTFMLDCDRCHNWFHGTCVGVAKDNLPNKWICDECTMQLLVLDQMKMFASMVGRGNTSTEERTNELSKEDKVQIMRLLLLRFLLRQETSSQSSFSRSSRHFHLAKFVHDVDGSRTRNNERCGDTISVNADMVCNHFLDLWNCNDTRVDGGQLCEYLSEEGNAKLMLTLNLQKSELVLSFPRLLGVVVHLMGDDNAGSLRKLAVKALSQIVQVDHSLMTNKSIRDAVAKRFKDDAISVREAAVSLVGFYVLQAPELAKSFHSPLLLRLNDNGVSVRKRAIKIFRDLILINPKYPGRAAVFMKLLMQAADRKEDDGVRDLIHETFLALWFANYKSYAGSNTSSAALVTPLRDGNISVGETSRQMVEVVSISSSPKHLIKLVQEMISGKGDNCEGKKRYQRKIDKGAAEQYCASIVACLIEELLVFEEQRDSYSQIEAGSQLTSLLTTIGVFAESSPLLLLDHYDSLLHYLKADNRVSMKCESLVVSHVCNILSHVSNSLNEVDLQRLGRGELSKDLVNITYKFGISASGAAVQTLAKLATHPQSKAHNPLMVSMVKLAKVFYKHLQKMKNVTDDFSKTQERERSNVHRALSVLGCICRHHNHEISSTLDDDLEQFIAVPLSDLTWANLPSASFAIFREYLNKIDARTRCKAVRAMSGIFSAHPRVMLAFEQDGTLREIMSDNAHPTLQLESLQCLREILIMEETRVESGEAKREMEKKNDITTSKKISGDQDGDASLIGACCIQNAGRLFEMTSSMHPAVRLNALLLIETLLRQGQLNPRDVIPILFALLGDLKEVQVRGLSLKLLTEQVEKRPNEVRLSFAKGVRQCFQFQRKIYKGHDLPSALLVDGNDSHGNDQIECIFGQIFHESIRSSRTHTNRVIKSLLRHFSENESHELSMLSFISEVIASLPYNHLENVLFIVHQISGIISVEGNDVLSKLTFFLCQHGLSSKDADPNEKDKLELAASNKAPSKAKGLSAVTQDAFDVATFGELCTKASAMLLLLRLSSFLREAFSGVTHARLSEFLPGARERISDRAPSRAKYLTPFNSEIPMISLSSKTSTKLDIMIKQYANFRMHMRSYDATQIFLSDSDGNRSEDSKVDSRNRKRSYSDE